ncbi:hypothetical protein BYT27DRAFT_6679013 [Phlegmacium glaucopus]|nr:hypothetical protein BYT27DRAFT_6679013 [Phlegmacium glaucopus]
MSGLAYISTIHPSQALWYRSPCHELLWSCHELLWSCLPQWLLDQSLHLKFLSQNRMLRYNGLSVTLINRPVRTGPGAQRHLRESPRDLFIIPNAQIRSSKMSFKLAIGHGEVKYDSVTTTF